MSGGVPDKRRRRAFALFLGALAAGFMLSRQHRPLVIYNATASAPIGFYRVVPAPPVHVGDLVLVRTPGSIRELAARRNYIPASVPLVKRVEARAGNRVCATDGIITVDGVPVATRKSTDGQGRPLPAWTGCRVLAKDEIFLLMTGAPDSFDSRYFGPVSLNAVIGRLTLLWQR